MVTRDGIKLLLTEWAQEMAGLGWTGQPNMLHKIRIGEIAGTGRPQPRIHRLPSRIERMDRWLQIVEQIDRTYFRACVTYGATESTKAAAKAMGINRSTYLQQFEGGLAILCALGSGLLRVGHE